MKTDSMDVADEIGFVLLANTAPFTLTVIEWHFRLLERLLLVSAVYVAARFANSAAMTVLEKSSAAALSGWVLLTWLQWFRRLADANTHGLAIGEVWQTTRGRVALTFGLLVAILGTAIMSIAIDSLMTKVVIDVSAAALEQLGSSEPTPLPTQ